MFRSVDNAGVQELFPEPIAGWMTVAVDRPIDLAGHGLTYAVPPELADLEIGAPVTVPLGRGNTPTAGWVTGRIQETEKPPGVIKFITDRRQGPPLPADLVELGCWMAKYWLAPPGPTLSAMLPAPVRRGTGTVTHRLIHLVSSPTEIPARCGPAQKRVLAFLNALPAEELPIERSTLRDKVGISTFGPIDALVQRGVLLETRRTSIHEAWDPTHLQVPPVPEPTPQQQSIIDDVLTRRTRYSANLLHGVTGAGKTEIYLRIMHEILEAGCHVLVLVPEIALTPQLAARLSARFPDEQVALLHSALPAATRNAHWHAIRRGDARITLGPRSAVFAPIPEGRLGLIVVDEEHDASLKQETTPRYHGRDVAIHRAHRAGCPILLCSATPSLESWHNAQSRDDWTLHSLTTRAPGLRTPRTRVVDLASERREDRDRGSSLGPTLRSALAETLRQNRQALLLLNRRGWATYLACSSRRCVWVLECAHCDAAMVYHRHGEIPSGGYVRCHHCLGEVRLPTSCEECGKPIARLGTGTQRLEEEILALHPELVEGQSLIRLDTDSMADAAGLHEILAAFQRGEVRVLLGTQMIAKGLDVPGVRLVGVIDADTALHLPDFRASERTFQLISQVTGRCGRGDEPGIAIVQTMDPDAPSIVAACRGAASEFLETELAHRRQASLPPASRMARIVVQDESLTDCETTIARICEAITSLAPESGIVLGPMPCPLARVRNRHRREILLTASTATAIQQWLHQAAADRILADPSVIVDIDPMSLL